ncbi:unnamed protein product [Lactuca virosa]|uniref:Oxidoreductase N-terminal domain-containing protein n=1 Tax=Lactuca virosa TaxID=75947 RepID=A0AAU9M8J7_9ASTR|nr:unnamed protein product [Lactuca virosa]
MEEVRNQKVIFKDYVNGFPKESVLILTTSATVPLQLPPQGSNGILLKNLYLFCDPYMCGRMTKIEGCYVSSFTPGSVFPEDLLLQLLKLMLHPDVGIRLIGNQLFSVLFIPTSNHLRRDTDASTSNQTRRWSSDTASMFASVKSLLDKLHGEKNGKEIVYIQDGVLILHLCLPLIIIVFHIADERWCP